MYAGTDFAKNEAQPFLDKLTKYSKVQVELTAEKSLEEIKSLDESLSRKPGSFDPLQATFQRENKQLLAVLTDSLETMKKDHGKTKTFEKAAAIGNNYGIDVSAFPTKDTKKPK
jgi:uncharacterized protein involved in copper resistance